MSDELDVYHKFKKDDVDQFMDNHIYLPTRTIYMGSMGGSDENGENGTDYLMAETVIKALHILDNQDSASLKGEKPINIIMNNIGGDVYHGMAIYDAISNCKNHVTIRVHGYAMSMGSIILQAADTRIMTKHSRIMVHYGSFGMEAHNKTTYKWAEECKRVDTIMENIFLEKIKGNKITLEKYLKLIDKTGEIPAGNAKNKKIPVGKKELEEMLNFDTIIDAETALELNLVDKIEDNSNG
jgi:ATP-dependent protease ClpP protease subunit